MKKLNLSLAAIFAMGTFAVAGGDIAPVEPVVEEPVVVASTGNFYIGAAYGAANFDITETYYPVGAPAGYNEVTSEDWDYSTIMLQAGYNFNQYIAIEARYWFGLDETVDTDILGNYDLSVDTFGIYVKPQYPVTEAFNIYALLGYANNDPQVDHAGTTTNFDSTDGFSWGIGAAYAFTENLSVFVDYVDMYNDDNDYTNIGGSYNDDITLSTWNFGVTYNF